MQKKQMSATERWSTITLVEVSPLVGVAGFLS